MSVYVIGDTHLSFSTDKPMNIFKGWDDYEFRLESNWQKLVEKDDTVIFMNFRPDRARQMTRIFVDDDFGYYYGIKNINLFILYLMVKQRFLALCIDKC